VILLAYSSFFVFVGRAIGFGKWFRKYGGKVFSGHFKK